MVSKVDKKILELLQQDARMPLTHIAKEVDMSENGVKYRLDKLEEKGVIQRYALQINPKKVGKKVMAIFNIEIEPKSMKKTIPLLTKTDEFIKVYHTTGQYSLTAMGVFDSNDSLTKFINDRLLTEFSIQSYTVNIITKQYKDSFYKI
jgi:DNA-binding Lrp family transcriptional regulator